MRRYRRILVLIPDGDQGDFLLRRAASLTQLRADSRLLVACLIEHRQVKGPVAGAGPRIPAVQRRLDLQLARHNLAWAETRVAAGAAATLLDEIVLAWQPDLLLACCGTAGAATRPDLDTLTVTCCGLPCEGRPRAPVTAVANPA